MAEIDEDDLQDIFLEEANEVIANGLGALDALSIDPQDLTQQTTLRRAFHTLKGSSRMVGLTEFGEAAWSLEQLLNAWLSEQKPASADLCGLSREAVWGGPETLFVISSDLSHFLSHAQAQAVDRQSVQTLLALQPTLGHRQACGATPINGLLLAARRHHLRPKLLALCNSGDTAGDRQRVVGYAAVAFHAANAPATETAAALAQAVPGDADNVLLPLARAAIGPALGQGPGAVDLPHPEWLKEPGASFVTLTRNGQLRGCIGSLQAHRPLIEDVQANAQAAAFRDPRFEPVSRAELEDIRIEVSLLSTPEAMRFSSEADALRQLRPGVDGVILECGGARGTFLPQVWEQLPEPADFIAQLKRKAGLRGDFWSDEVRLSRYTVRHWIEPANPAGGTP